MPPNLSISMGQGMNSQRANMVPLQQQPNGINIISYTDGGMPQTMTADGSVNNPINTSVVTYPFITVFYTISKGILTFRMMVFPSIQPICRLELS